VSVALPREGERAGWVGGWAGEGARERGSEGARRGIGRETCEKRWEFSCSISLLVDTPCRVSSQVEREEGKERVRTRDLEKGESASVSGCAAPAHCCFPAPDRHCS